MALLQTFHTNKDNTVHGFLTSQYTNHTYNYYMEVHLVSQDVTNNRSVIYVKAWGKSTSATYKAWGGSAPYYVKVNGVQQASGTGINFSDMAVVPLGQTGNITINHNADGTGSFTASANFGYVASSLSKGEIYTQTITLPTIPRATQPTLSAGTTQMNSAVTINTPRASGSFTHTLKYSFGGSSGTIATGVGTSFAWTIPIALASQIPNTTSGTGTITCETYNGSTLIGSKTVGFTATVPTSIVPTVSIGKSGVDLYSSKYVQGRSKVSVTLTDGGSYGSTISARSTTVKSGNNTITSSSSKTFTSGAINYHGTIDIATTVTDSRGRSASASTTITVVAYSPPSASWMTAFRSNADGSPNAQGSHMRIGGTGVISPIDNTNTKVTILRYRERGATDWIEPTFNGDSYNPTIYATVSADENKSYEVQVYVADYFTSSNQVRSVGTAFVLMDFHTSGLGMAIGKVAEGRGVLDIAGTVYLNGKTLIDQFQSKLRIDNGAGTVRYIKIMEAPSSIGSVNNRFSAWVDGLGDFGSPTACLDFVAFSSRGGPYLEVLRFRQANNLSGASFGLRSAGGKSELWIKTAPYNYSIDVTISNVDGLIDAWGILDIVTTEPVGITYPTPVIK